MRVGITSCANDTKWRELQAYMAEAPGRPSWRLKMVPRASKTAWEAEFDHGVPDLPDPAVHPLWDGDWHYHFRGRGWNTGNEYEMIEWCDLRLPAPPQPGDQEVPMTRADIIGVCARIGFDFEVMDGFVRIYGYRRSGA